MHRQSSSNALSRRSLLGVAGAGLSIAAIAPAQAIFEPGAKLDRTGFEPTFEDNFESFDRFNGKTGRWRTVYGYGGPHALENRTLPPNGELQIYMDPEFAGPGGGAPIGIDPFSVRDGVLSIEADLAPPGVSERIWGYRFTSGVMTTRFSFAQIHGHFEMRAKLPAGRGLWPAFWLLPQNGAWPPEIDIMEMLGKDPHTWYATIRTKNGLKQNTTDPIRGVDTSSGFHTYAVTWRRDSVRWYFDDMEVAHQPSPPEMVQPMYMLINMSIGGPWGGAPDSTTPFPARMQVKHVRAYQVPD